MNYYQHLVKLSNVRYGGTRWSLFRLVLVYNVTYFFWRPFLVKLLRGGTYRGEKKLFYTVLTGGYDQLNEIPEKADGTQGLGIMANLAARLGYEDIVRKHIERDPLVVDQ